MFEELKSLIESGKVTQEEADTVHTAYKSRIEKADNEAAKYRTKLKEVESSYETKLGEQKQELEEKISEARKAGETEIVEKYEAKLNTVLAEKSELEEKAKSATIEAFVSKAVAEMKPANPYLASLAIKENLDIDGDNVFIKLGDERLSFDSGVKKLFEEKKIDVVSVGNPGSGAGNGGGSGGNKTVSKSDFLSMSPKQQADLRAQNPNILSELK